MDLRSYPSTQFGEAREIPGRHGYVAYFPAPLPRSLDLPAATIGLLAAAERALGQLHALGELLPAPELLTRPYLLREALFSTRIEGTQATIVEVLESGASDLPHNADVEEVVNYVAAMRWGLDQLGDLPFSVRLVREIHLRLMDGVRGRERAPGELRRSQNWIGAPGSTLRTAAFVPPPPEELASLLSDWERFAHEETELPLLVQDALLHAQFETIHPFLDGNGRLGRLLLVYFLVMRGRLPAPLLYLSSYIEQHRDAYYASLQTIREEGDPVPWIDLCLRAMETQALDAVARSRRIIELRDLYLAEAADVGPNGARLVDLVCESPFLTTKPVEERLGVARPTALRLLRRLEERGVLTALEPGPRGQRRYLARAMMDALAARVSRAG
jgi:Fic family protein